MILALEVDESRWDPQTLQSTGFVSSEKGKREIDERIEDSQSFRDWQSEILSSVDDELRSTPVVGAVSALLDEFES